MSKESNKKYIEMDAREVIMKMYHMHRDILGFQRPDLLPKMHEAFGFIESLWQLAAKNHSEGKPTTQTRGDIADKLLDLLRELAEELQAEHYKHRPDTTKPH